MNVLELASAHEIKEVDAVAVVECPGVEISPVDELLVDLDRDHLGLQHIVELDELGHGDRGLNLLHIAVNSNLCHCLCLSF